MQEMQEMQIRSLGQEDPLVTHSSILAWRIPWTEKSGGLQSIGSQRVRHDWSDLAHTRTISWRFQMTKKYRVRWGIKIRVFTLTLMAYSTVSFTQFYHLFSMPVQIGRTIGEMYFLSLPFLASVILFWFVNHLRVKLHPPKNLLS